MFVSISILFLTLIQSPTQLGDLSYVVPSGWSKDFAENVVTLRPKALSEGQVLTVSIPLAEKYDGDLATAFRQVWQVGFTEQGFSGKASPEKKTSKQGWSFVIGAGEIKKDGHSLLALIFVAKPLDKLQTVIVLSDSAKTNEEYAAAMQEFFGGLSFKGYVTESPKGSNGGVKPTNQPKAGAWDASKGVVGVWWGAKTGITVSGYGLFDDFVVFFPDGLYANDLPLSGLDGLDFVQARRDQPGIWGAYTTEGRKGTVTGLTKTPRAFALNDRGGLSMDGGNYGRALCPTGLRFDGAFGVEGIDDLWIKFTKDGAFEDHDLLARSDSTNRIPEIHRSGSGRYEIRNYSLILSYSDGRKAKLSFFLKNSADPKAPDTIFLGKLMRVKR